MKDVPPPSDSVRGRYERNGAEAYYRDFGADYRNPHEPIVVKSLEQAVKQWPLDLADVLDLAAGSGEATLALRALGAKRIDGIDPYTAGAYQARTGATAAQIGFDEIAAGALAGRGYSLIVCSFAMHLCPTSRLPGLVWQLRQVGKSMLIVTPHKRPILRPEWGWELTRELLIERVRTRLYQAADSR